MCSARHMVSMHSGARCFERNSKASLKRLSKSKRGVDAHAFERRKHATDTGHAPEPSSALAGEDRNIRRGAECVREHSVHVRRRKLRIAGVFEADANGEARGKLDRSDVLKLEPR